MRFNHYLTLAALSIGLFASAQTVSTRYAQPGIGGVVLKEFQNNNLVKDLDLPLNTKLGEAGTTVESRTQWLNDQNAGLQILRAYIDNINDFDKMREDARNSISQADLDEAMMAGTDDAEMIMNILYRRLQNNYVLFVDQNPNNGNERLWEIYKIDLTPDLYNAFINIIGMPDEQVQIPMKFVKSGKYSQSDIDSEYRLAETSSDERDQYAVFRRLSKDVPDLAIGGPIIKSHPYRARIPEVAGAKKLQRYYVYRTVSKDGELKSKNIGIAYVTRVLGDEVQLYTLNGRSGSPKRGDYAVLTHGGKSAFSVSGYYGIAKNGNYPGVRLEYDMMNFLTPVGISGHLLVDLDAQFMGHGNEYAGSYNDTKYQYISINSEGNAYAVSPNPLRLGLGVGYGVAYNFMGRFSVMPYIRANAGMVTFLSLKENDKNHVGSSSLEAGTYLPVTNQAGNLSITEDDKADFFEARGDVGARFSINLVKQISIFFGAEYNYHFGFGKKTSADITAADYFYKKDYLGHGKSCINFLAGVRIVSF